MNRHSFCLLMLMALLLAAAPSALAGTQFSADMVQKSGGETHRMRYYQGDQKMRTEMRNEDGEVVTAIIDLRARRMLQLMTRDKMYMEMPMGGEFAAWAAGEATQEEHYEMKRIGTETVKGYLCDKYLLLPKKQGLEKTTIWIAKKLGYPVKTVAESHSMELTNIREGDQPAVLFKVPADYKKMPGMEEYYRSMKEEGDEEAPAEPAERGQREASEIEKDAQEIGDDARSEVKSAIKEELSDSIRKGIRGLFGKD
jgi:outer membrane lipoprotein-sorting protein